MVSNLGAAPRRSTLVFSKYFALIGLLPWSVAFAACDVDVIAHRGDSYHTPENTVIGIREAINRGARLIEVDVRLSRDGVPVLMHDADVDRTTNGTGPASAFSAKQLAELDAGSWRHGSFRGEPVPTLQAAIAAAYPRARLYLDIKEAGLSKPIGDVLSAGGFAPDSILIAVSDEDALRRYHADLPHTPLVWFGAIPSNWDDAWFDSLLAHNVTAIEVFWPTLQKTANVLALIERAKAKKLGVWTYLLNDTTTLRAALAHGVSGIETDFVELLGGACADPTPRSGPQPRIAGQWDFAAANLDATIGSKLVPQQLAGEALTFGSAEQLGVPALHDGAGHVMRVGALQPNQGLIMYPNMHPAGQGNGEFINRYSLIMDLLRPVASENQWQALLQTDIFNRSDADLFINPDGAVGVADHYHGRIVTNHWHRLAVVVDLTRPDGGEMRTFIDGDPVGSIPLDGIDNRWSIYSTLPSLGTLLFSDDNGETAPLFVNSIQIRNYAMTDQDVAALGGPSAQGIPDQIATVSHD